MNPRFETLIVAVGGKPSAFPPPRSLGDPDEPWFDIEYLLCRKRLSKEEVRAKGKMNINSIDVQERHNEDYAKREKLPILRHFSDSDLSGEVFEEGPQWKAMIAYLKKMPEEKRKRTAIIMKAPDRFGRELRKMLIVLYDLEQLRVRVRFADFPYMKPETLEGWLQFVDFAKMAAFERMMIKIRTKDALDERVDRGAHLGNHPKHFHTDDQGRIEPDKIAEQVVSARLAGMSYIQIAAQFGISDDEAFRICQFMRSEVERLALRVATAQGR